MNIYKYTPKDNESFILEPLEINPNNYNITDIGDNKKLFEKIKSDDINNINELKNYDFTYSKILEGSINEGSINESKITKLNYKQILERVCNIINDGATIIKNAILSIKINTKNTDYKEMTRLDYTYMDNQNIWIACTDANKCLYEIYNQCSMNKIKLRLKIKMSNDNIVNIIVKTST
jgi:hypothetical protein